MIVNEILSLLEIVKNIASHKAELDKRYFEQFIQPAWEAFTKVHETYKQLFREHVDFVSKDDYNSNALIERAKRDYIYMTDLRVTLVEIVENFPSSKLKTREQYLSDFIRSVLHYFDVGIKVSVEKTGKNIEFCLEPHNFDLERKGKYWIDSSHQYIMGMIIGLQQINSKNKKETIRLLDDVAILFQSRYEEVATAYHILRTDLLS